MFHSLIAQLRTAGLPVSITEYLTLLGAMRANVAAYSVDDFYYLSRATLVKDERHLDRFDRVFAQVFKGVQSEDGVAPQDIPEEWLRLVSEKILTPEEMAAIEALGGFEKLMETLRQRLEEQQERHVRAAANGSAPGAPVRSAPTGIIQRACASGRRKAGIGGAVKVWDKRDFRDLDGDIELGTRNMKVALRKTAPLRAPGGRDRARSAGHHPCHREQRRHAGSHHGSGTA